MCIRDREYWAKLHNVGTTAVEKPDITGKKIVEEEISETVSKSSETVSKSFIGKYQTNIFKESKDDFLKVGKKTLEITKIEDGYVHGTYKLQHNEDTGFIDKTTSFKAENKSNDSALIIDSDKIAEESTLDNDSMSSIGSIDFDYNSASIRISFKEYKGNEASSGYLRRVDSDLVRVFE